MQSFFKVSISAGLIALFLFRSVHAEDHSSILFFSSNNTNEISLETAYARLIGKEQRQLQNKIIHVMQKHHVEQGKFDNILGTYQFSSSQNITADNTDLFNTSPYQKLSDEKIIIIAKELANFLKQESVAIFVPSSKHVIGDITVSFISHQPTITEVINLLHTKLPPMYSKAFSLHLNNEHAHFADLKVAEIEWLGSQPKLEDLNQAFPLEKISFRYGIAYLVYKNGQKQPL